MKRAAMIVGLMIFLCYSVVAETKTKPPVPKPAVVKRSSIWRKLLVPAKYAFAGLLRIKLDSRGEPYE